MRLVSLWELLKSELTYLRTYLCFRTCLFSAKFPPNEQERFQPNFHESSKTVNIRILSRQNFEFLSVGAGGSKTTKNTENSIIGVQSFDHESKTNQNWSLSTCQFFWVGVSSSSSYWLNSRVDVLEPALSQHRQDAIHLAWHEAQSCQESYRSALQFTSVPDGTYIREEPRLHYRSRVKHERPYHQTLPVTLLPIRRIRTVRHSHHQPSKLWSMPSSARESISPTASSIGRVPASLTVSNRF